ncbi:MAG: LamG-like jellyroll fold domain-containing protein [Planctomycetota bacterium]|jgi:prepilin-type N-terminal cleavage/methylation domain-containing protein
MNGCDFRSTAGTDRRESGVTLIELLVVLALMGVLMGLGIGMYANLGRQSVFTANVTRVLNTLNQVRNSSMRHPAALQITAGDPAEGEENSVRGLEFVTLFQSTCEAPDPDIDEMRMVGAFGRDGILPAGADFVGPGKLGKALHLTGGGAVRCGNYPAYDATEGIALDVWVKPLTNRGGTIIRRGRGLALELIRRGDGLAVRLDLVFAEAASAEDTGGAVVQGSTSSSARSFEPTGAILPVGRWARIVATYDRSELIISVDTGRGPVQKLREKINGPLVPSRDDELTLGGGGGRGRTFDGWIDDVRIDGVLGSDIEAFPPQVQVKGPTRRIHFKGGKLDPQHHARPQTIVITQGKKRRTIVVGTEGNLLRK